MGDYHIDATTEVKVTKFLERLFIALVIGGIVVILVYNLFLFG